MSADRGGGSGEEKTPPARTETIRDAICSALRREELTARDISGCVGIPERDVAPHLDHIQKSVTRSGERLLVAPATCVGCGFRFEARERRSRPSRCPKCKSERIDPPRFSIVAAKP
jgi:hypothetical protein